MILDRTTLLRCSLRPDSLPHAPNQRRPYTMTKTALVAALFAMAAPLAHAAATPDIPVLVPITGFLAAEGGSQRNGALLALRNPPAGVTPSFAVTDTGTSPEGAVNALERAMSNGKVTAVVASMLGTQILAMLPIALEQKVPLTTMSGTADITRKGNPYVFRFFPADSVVKGAQVRLCDRDLSHPAPRHHRQHHRLRPERPGRDRQGAGCGGDHAGLPGRARRGGEGHAAGAG